MSLKLVTQKHDCAKTKKHARKISKENKSTKLVKEVLSCPAQKTTHRQNKTVTKIQANEMNNTK